LEFNHFPCNGCGLCCQNIGQIDDLKEYDRGDGVCKFLNEKKCQIYDERPLICRVDEMYDKVFYQHFLKEEYYLENAKACQKLQIENGLSVEDQIDLKKVLGV
jgi:uncharacterized protein